MASLRAVPSWGNVLPESCAKRLITPRAPSLWRNVVWTTLALAGGVLLVGAGALLYFSAVPEMVSGIRPFSV